MNSLKIVLKFGVYSQEVVTEVKVKISVCCAEWSVIGSMWSWDFVLDIGVLGIVGIK